jgi:hypothetical protein
VKPGDLLVVRPCTNTGNIRIIPAANWPYHAYFRASKIANILLVRKSEKTHMQLTLVSFVDGSVMLAYINQNDLAVNE